MNAIKNYFATLQSVLFHPRAFFRDLPSQGGISTPLAFALVTHWLGAFFEFLWVSIFKFSQINWLSDLFSTLEDEVHYSGKSSYTLKAKEWLMSLDLGTGFGLILLDPFKTLFGILLAALSIFIGAWFLVSKKTGDQHRPVDLKSTIRMVCYTISPSILTGIPLLGAFIPFIYILVLNILGIAAFYRVSHLRAIAIYLFPMLILFGILMVFALTLVLISVLIMTQ